MNLYYVKCTVLCGNNWQFLVKANNKKEALNKVWEEYYIPVNKTIRTDRGYELYYKKDFIVQNVEKELFCSTKETMVML